MIDWMLNEVDWVLVVLFLLFGLAAGIGLGALALLNWYWGSRS